jgi:hypothetical protein
VTQNNFHVVDIISICADDKVLVHWPIVFNILENLNYHFKNTGKIINTAVTLNKVSRVLKFEALFTSVRVKMCPYESQMISKHSAVRIITSFLHFPRVYKPIAACAQCGRRGLEKEVVGKGGGAHTLPSYECAQLHLKSCAPLIFTDAAS